MKYNLQKHNRKAIRLKGYDYSRTGLYFITICCYEKTCLFGDVIDDEIRLNTAGIIARNCWLAIPKHFPNVQLHQFVIMPNHIHGIIEFIVGAKNFSPLQERHERQGQRAAGTSKTVGSVVRGFKIGVTKWMRNNTDVYRVWQRNYYEPLSEIKNPIKLFPNISGIIPKTGGVTGSIKIDFRILHMNFFCLQSRLHLKK